MREHLSLGLSRVGKDLQPTAVSSRKLELTGSRKVATLRGLESASKKHMEKVRAHRFQSFNPRFSSNLNDLWLYLKERPKHLSYLEEKKLAVFQKQVASFKECFLASIGLIERHHGLAAEPMHSDPEIYGSILNEREPNFSETEYSSDHRLRFKSGCLILDIDLERETSKLTITPPEPKEGRIPSGSSFLPPISPMTFEIPSPKKPEDLSFPEIPGVSSRFPHLEPVPLEDPDDSEIHSKSDSSPQLRPEEYPERHVFEDESISEHDSEPDITPKKSVDSMESLGALPADKASPPVSKLPPIHGASPSSGSSFLPPMTPPYKMTIEQVRLPQIHGAIPISGSVPPEDPLSSNRRPTAAPEIPTPPETPPEILDGDTKKHTQLPIPEDSETNFGSESESSASLTDLGDEGSKKLDDRAASPDSSGDIPADEGTGVRFSPPASENDETDTPQEYPDDFDIDSEPDISPQPRPEEDRKRQPPEDSEHSFVPSDQPLGKLADSVDPLKSPPPADKDTEVAPDEDNPPETPPEILDGDTKKHTQLPIHEDSETNFDSEPESSASLTDLDDEGSKKLDDRAASPDSSGDIPADEGTGVRFSPPASKKDISLERVPLPPTGPYHSYRRRTIPPPKREATLSATLPGMSISTDSPIADAKSTGPAGIAHMPPPVADSKHPAELRYPVSKIRIQHLKDLLSSEKNHTDISIVMVRKGKSFVPEITLKGVPGETLVTANNLIQVRQLVFKAYLRTQLEGRLETTEIDKIAEKFLHGFPAKASDADKETYTKSFTADFQRAHPDLRLPATIFDNYREKFDKYNQSSYDSFFQSFRSELDKSTLGSLNITQLVKVA